MENYDFILENLRFHIYEENTIIFFGWYRDDNPEKRYLEVFLDKKKLEIEYHNQTGIPVRQKYLRYKANVSEEIQGIVHLPDNWREAKELRIYCVNGDKKVLTMALKSDWLQRRRDSIECYVETDQYVDGKLILAGWAVADGEIKYRLVDHKGNDIKYEITRNYRRDVKAVFEEIDDDYMCGFKIEAPVKKFNRGKLFLSCGEKKSVYDTAIRSLNADGKEPGIFVKGINYFRRYGLAAALIKTKAKLLGEKDVDDAKFKYKEWIQKYGVKQEELEEQRNTTFAYQPTFSIVIPLYNTRPKYLKEMVDSIIGQTYTNWQLCLADASEDKSLLSPYLKEYAQKDSRIEYKELEENKGISKNTNAAIEMATGDFIVLADHDDIMPANALFECARALNEDATIDIIYSDEDKVDMSGKKYFEPHFKSDFNIDLLCSMNYICHLFVVKKEIIEEVGMLRSEFDGAQDHDFILRCTEVARNIKHIPKILYHWRCHINSTASNPESKMYAFEAGRKAVQEHYDRIGIPAEVEHGQFYGMYKTKFLWEGQPLISIVIPNKDHVDDLKKCMDSIEEKSTYRNFEFVIVENNSTEQETFEYYKEIEEKENVTVLYYEGEFNFSRINNYGVKNAKGEYILLLNNDTEIINPDCLKEMLGYCMRNDVGIVGARLYYEDDTIQHAGVILGFGGMAGHAFIGSSRFDNGYFSRIICAQDLSAVTAACMMVKKEIFEAVGGLTEEYRVAFNDIDFCMKVRALGKLIVYNPAVELYHYESKSRGLEDTPEKVERFNSEVARFIESWSKELEAGDPYYNPNLTLDKADFSLKE